MARPLSAPESIQMQQMQVGDSFLVTEYRRYLFVTGRVGKVKPRKFSIRKSPGGWRVERVQ